MGGRPQLYKEPRLQANRPLRTRPPTRRGVAKQRPWQVAAAVFQHRLPTETGQGKRRVVGSRSTVAGARVTLHRPGLSR
jgi:hypothetical protein